MLANCVYARRARLLTLYTHRVTQQQQQKNSFPQSEENVRLFYQAAQHQTDVMIRNILGQGMDIHLLGLRQLARQSGCRDAIAVFDDASFEKINHFALSTSQV